MIVNEILNLMEDLYCTKAKYNIESYPNYLIVQSDTAYSEIENNKYNNFKLKQDKLKLNVQKK